MAHGFAIFQNASMLADRLAYGNDPHGEAMEDILRCDLLIVDDVGRGRGSPFERETLWKVISHRHAECLATIVTTNLGPAAFMADDLGAAILSRTRRQDTFLFEKRYANGEASKERDASVRP